ncbi:MAG: FAD-dependent oxidoreductase [Planctomycetes bacterium]|nr:FAD-dependent oxidoreductase [Planctomycetota bacterium]MBL7147139.1 FAD-dependent oxidoreductase [Phycisphaerae bacterium]
MEKGAGIIREKKRKINKSFQLTLLMILVFILFVMGGCPKTSPQRAVSESSRDIPVAYDVDVVVVGGTSGGVAAALEAAQNGAKVFLAAQRPYLGADICATYRLWLEPDEVPTLPLPKKIFAEPSVPLLARNRIKFTYETDKPSADVHKDTPTPSLLTDGKWHSASSQSVQYNGNVTIIADLGAEHQLEKVHIMSYQRRNPAGDDFEVENITVSISDDKQQWKQHAVIKNQRIGESLPEPWGPIELSASITANTRYIKFMVKKSPDVTRVLLGEIVIEEKHSLTQPAELPARIPPTPMQVKRTLDEALLKANVQFLYGCYATDVLFDDDGRVAGIVMANRSGRQAVKARVVIDATSRANVARMAGAAFKQYPAGLQTFKRIVVGGGVRTNKDIQARTISTPVSAKSGLEYTAIEYTLKIPMKDGSFNSFAKAEQIARDKTWHPNQTDASETLFQVPPDPMKGEKTLSESWPGAEKVDLDAFRPEGVNSLFVISGCADIPREAAEKLMRPLELMKVGTRIGALAASQAEKIAKADNVKILSKTVSGTTSGDIRENLSGIKKTLTETLRVHADKRSVPILKEVDVVVVGGGTGGAPAGISAARHGAKTLVLEYLYGLGGVGTTGFISKYYYGNITGFTKEMDDGIMSFGGSGKHKDGGWNIILKKEWYRRKLHQAGAEVWFGVLGCGAFVEDGRLKGIVVATPEGRGVVLAKVVIDSTGNADIAAAAGAVCEYTSGSVVAVQGAGLPGHNLGAGYTNTDWTFIDDTDVIDVWRAFVVAKNKFKDAYDLGQLADTRERRRIVGDFVMSPLDISNNRTYPDTIVIARSNFDTHGFTIHPVFMLKPPDRKAMFVNVPYRCLLPKGLDGILVTGLGVSAHRDAMPVIRMQPDIQNQGYAAGLAAAMSVKSGRNLRQIDIKELQKHLIELGTLPEQVLTEKDSYPLPQEILTQAVESLVNDFDGLEIVLAHIKYTMPLLRKAYDNAEDAKVKLTYAHVLGMLGHPSGSDTLIEAVKSRSWDQGWNYTGMGQFGASISELDSLIIALGRTRDKQGLKPIIEKIEQLDADSEFSHYRAVAIALETLNHPNAAEPLAKLLKKPGMAGHAFMDINTARNRTPSGPVDTLTRNWSLRELVLARALYRCGDYKGMGKQILTEYAHDLRGHYARHAREVLKEQE